MLAGSLISPFRVAFPGLGTLTDLARLTPLISGRARTRPQRQANAKAPASRRTTAGGFSTRDSAVATAENG